MKCYGITKDPETNDFMLVMNYASGGDLYNHLRENFKTFAWNKSKLKALWQILNGYVFFLIIFIILYLLIYNSYQFVFKIDSKLFIIMVSYIEIFIVETCCFLN